MAGQRALRTHSLQGGLAQGLMLESHSDNKTCHSDLSGKRQVQAALALPPLPRHLQPMALWSL